ncbi:MAG: trypsin-like serine protease [Verrucomicrobiota bacterium]
MISRSAFIACATFSALFTGPSLHSIGMRHDVGEEPYLAAGANEGAFAPSQNFPDLSPVCSIGAIRGKGNGAFEHYGTGTLIGDRFVLTAAHVVISERNPNRFESNLEVRFGSNSDRPTETLSVSKIHTRLRLGSRALEALSDDSDAPERLIIRAEFNDIALLELVDQPKVIQPAAVADRLPPLGSRVVIAGYGDAGFGDDHREARWQPAGERRACENTLDRDVVTNPETGRENDGGLIMFDFDSPARDRNTLEGEAARGWEDLIGSGTSVAAPLPLEGVGYPGDSGGPAFAYIDEAWRIIGVCGYGTGYPAHRKRERIQYGDISIYTRVPSHSDWINEVQAP